jgi:hypothetical protein
LHEPQLWPLVEVSENLTESLDSLTVALASVLASNDADPTATPPASSIRRENGVDPRVWDVFFMTASLSLCRLR